MAMMMVMRVVTLLVGAMVVVAMRPATVIVVALGSWRGFLRMTCGCATGVLCVCSRDGYCCHQDGGQNRLFHLVLLLSDGDADRP
jgi:hypothetical protein